MFQKTAGAPQTLFPARRTTAPRPESDATEIFDTDFEEDFEDGPERNSPRASINSVGKNSLSTISSYDEAVTPISNHFGAFDFRLDNKPVEGPRGPHLFRVSQDSYTGGFNFHLSMSPMTPEEPALRTHSAFRSSPATVVPHAPRSLPIPDEADVRCWSPREVAAWVTSAGFDDAVVDNFKRNDISGAVLVDLQLEDLRELGIQSFGKRHRLWNEIRRLRGSPLSSPVDDSPISSPRSPSDECMTPHPREDGEVRRRRSRKHRRPQVNGETIVSPAKSVSIVGIEQLIPKPHKCSKGERCSKWRRQQRQLALLAQEHPISPEHGGQIVITGDPGNAATAEAILRPVSDAVPSVVASSDVLGPAQQPPIQLAEEHLRAIEFRDPQENVKQFLTFQHVQTASPATEFSPSSPQYEMFPPMGAPRRAASVTENLRSLPKLTIPQTRTAVTAASPASTIVPAKIDRFGTPCSAMDVPVTAVPLGPVARDFSQSVPPDMRYRRTSPSSAGPPRHSWQTRFGMARVDEDVQQEAVVEVPPPTLRAKTQPAPAALKDANHAGWMKKRKTKFLRHEWQEHHFTLRGTSLAMRADPRSSQVLEHIDVDDYAIACSSLASNKLSAAFKAMKLSGAKNGPGDLDGVPAFAFQLVPAAEKKGIKHAATGKTHHFAVKSRDDRIDWMRELMLAKALKQKGEGYQISLNGNMI